MATKQYLRLQPISLVKVSTLRRENKMMRNARKHIGWARRIYNRREDSMSCTWNTVFKFTTICTTAVGQRRMSTTLTSQE